MLDTVVYYLVRFLISLLNLLPITWRVRGIARVIKTIVFFIPSYKKVAYKNLRQVFPDASKETLDGIYYNSFFNLARVFVDFARLHTLDAAWVQEHVSCPALKTYREIKNKNPNQGILLVTGHLGSFELLAHSIAMFGHPVSFIVRNFKLPKVDAWWTAGRERYGNRIIPRNGAVKVVLKNIAEGKDVALLFDQNVKRNHAIFVEHFGRIAATTVTVGLAATRSSAPILVSYIRYVGSDKYKIEAEECDCSDIYNDTAMNSDQKIVAVTQRVTKIFERMITEYPEGWFWMHRRWKTVPEGMVEDFYRS